MKAVIFDMDGVLVDSEPIHQRTELDALAAFGLHLEKKDLYPYAGTTRDAFQKGISLQYNFHPDWKAVFEHKDRHFYELMKDVNPMPGVLPLIREMKAAGLKLAIATSGQERSMATVLDKFSLTSVFDASICARDVSKSKPDPQAFLLAAERMQIQPADCVVFEDSINGIRAAKAAGMFAIGVTGTFAKELLCEADRIVEKYDGVSAHEIILL
jgi:HAD superfamily hydrolase (TIGR01509 family)